MIDGSLERERERALIYHWHLFIKDDLKQYGRIKGWCPYFLARYTVIKKALIITC